MPRQITLSIDSDGVTCGRCPFVLEWGWDKLCQVATAMGADSDVLEGRDWEGNPLCLPECSRGGVTLTKPELATCDLSRSGSETAPGLRREA